MKSPTHKIEYETRTKRASHEPMRLPADATRDDELLRLRAALRPELIQAWIDRWVDGYGWRTVLHAIRAQGNTFRIYDVRLGREIERVEVQW